MAVGSFDSGGESGNLHGGWRFGKGNFRSANSGVNSQCTMRVVTLESRFKLERNCELFLKRCFDYDARIYDDRSSDRSILERFIFNTAL
jgi:hypothetical protein